MAVEVDVLASALADFNVVAHSEFKLKPEQEVAVISLLVGKDVLAFVCAKDFEMHDFYGS